MRATPRRWWGRFWSRGIGRLLGWKRRDWCFITPARFAIRRSRRCLTGWRIIRSIGRRGNSLASWGAWRRRRGRRFLSALLICRWRAGRLLIANFRISWLILGRGLPAHPGLTYVSPLLPFSPIFLLPH